MSNLRAAALHAALSAEHGEPPEQEPIIESKIKVDKPEQEQEREAYAKVCEDGINAERYPLLAEVAAAHGIGSWK